VRASAVIGAVAVVAIGLGAGRARALTPEKSLAQLSIEGWQVKDGLPGDSVRAIEQASDGRLWIATFGGLVRYDGVTLSPVNPEDDLKLAVADVSTLLAARDGSVWMGSNHHGPMRFSAGVIRGFGEGDGLPAGTIPLAWAEDDEGQVWMASKRGLYKFANDRFVPRPVRGLGKVIPTALRIDANGTVWIGSTSGLFTVVGDRIEVPAGVDITAPITGLHIDRRRTLWVAAGVNLYALNDGKSARQGQRQWSAPAPIAQMASDGDDNLWLATQAGLVRFRDGQLQPMGAGDGMPTGEVTAVLIDRERGLWVGTRAGGLVHLTDRTLDTHAGPPGLDGLETMALCEDDAGAFWFGTRGKGAVRWQRGEATWFDERSGLPTDTVTAILPAKAGHGEVQGDVWLGTTSGLVRWHAGKIEDPKIWPSRVRTLYRDRAGALWIGGDGVLGRYVDGALSRFTPKQGLMGGHVRALAEDEAGVLYVSGVGGLVRRSGDAFVKTTPLASKIAGAVRSMLLDSEGAFWMTTGRVGLVRVLHGRAVTFDAKVGLEPDMLYGVLEDNDGDLWIGTNKSILRVSRSSLEAVAEQRHTAVQVASFETTDRRAGIIAAQLHQPSALKASDGALWFLTQNGPVRIDPRAVHTNTVVPRLAIDAVLADGNPVAGGGRTRLAPRPARVEFQYSAVSLLQPGKVRYRTWLEGFDPTWVEAGDRRTAVYANLPAGAYRFRVQARNNDGVWNERGANFNFFVDPPFYAHLWFYFACALCGLPIAWLVHRSRVARLRAQYLGVLTERTRMARELHDTLLQGMTTVAMQLHGLRKQFADAPAPARRQLDVVHETVTQCLDETRRVVRGLRDDERSQGALGPALERLAQRLCDGADRSGRASDDPGPLCDVQIDGQPRPLPHAVQDELYRIGQEALTNALRHAEADRIELRLSYEAALVRLVVTDDGRGFDPADLAAVADGAHFGLKGLRERAASIGATLDVRSKTGAGTVIEAVVEAQPRPASPNPSSILG
jgi:signal transduction histidine kinase/ligand-binding sensor domain-containing protein